MGTPKKLTSQKLEKAARLRYMGQMAWQDVAEAVGVSQQALWARRQTDDWQDAVDAVVAEMQQEAVPEAYAALMRAAKDDDVQAAKEILQRLEGAVAQKLEHSGDVEISWKEALMQSNGSDPDDEVESGG